MKFPRVAQTFKKMAFFSEVSVGKYVFAMRSEALLSWLVHRQTVMMGQGHILKNRPSNLHEEILF